MDTVRLDFPALPAAKAEETGDWTYTMRRDMQEILPGLYLGPFSAAMRSKWPILESRGITHIVCVRQDIEANFIKPNFPDCVRYLVLNIADSPVDNIIRYFPMTKDFIDGCLQSGGKVLVHGNAGISRSAALVIAYIMETFGLKYRDAFVYLQQRRFCINPNVGFVNQLQEYEAIYLARLTIKKLSPYDIKPAHAHGETHLCLFRRLGELLHRTAMRGDGGLAESFIQQWIDQG